MLVSITQSTVIPPVINEATLSPFKFWFQTSIHDGMYYHNELFCRWCTVTATDRAQLFHYACQLIRQNAVVITADEQQCSLWVSLRSPIVAEFEQVRAIVPSFLQITQCR
ncbi:MAG: hypothetical protein HC881_13850 [Leptolyngbyaceae cyanobacterium SL_7_1]|nr:hypothetical protein [Leptolyngbyaceae cyanobacterium SL_7_1]